MKIDHTKRRAFVAFAMDAMARALSDEEAIGPWLQDGVPDGTFDEVDSELCERVSAPYVDVVEGISAEDWNDLCRCWAFVMLHGCFGFGKETMGTLKYERGSLS